MPVDVRIETGAGFYDFVVHDSLSVQSFTLHVPAAPTSLLIDPDSWILSEKTTTKGK